MNTVAAIILIIVFLILLAVFVPVGFNAVVGVVSFLFWIVIAIIIILLILYLLGVIR